MEAFSLLLHILLRITPSFWLTHPRILEAIVKRAASIPSAEPTFHTFVWRMPSPALARLYGSIPQLEHLRHRYHPTSLLLRLLSGTSASSALGSHPEVSWRTRIFMPHFRYFLLQPVADGATTLPFSTTISDYARDKQLYPIPWRITHPDNLRLNRGAASSTLASFALPR